LSFTHHGRLSSINPLGRKENEALMFINKALLLLICIALIFYPAIGDWLLEDSRHWHRPYLLWLLVVLAAYWNQRTRDTDEL